MPNNSKICESLANLDYLFCDDILLLFSFLHLKTMDFNWIIILHVSFSSIIQPFSVRNDLNFIDTST